MTTIITLIMIIIIIIGIISKNIMNMDHDSNNNSRKVGIEINDLQEMFLNSNIYLYIN